MLTILEEVVLLAADEKTGRVRSTREFGTAYALVGAVFFDATLTGNATLDRVLTHRAARPTSGQYPNGSRRCSSSATTSTARPQSLMELGVLRHEQSKLLWVIDVERCPMVENKPQQHVKLRLANAILTDDIPDTRDIMLVAIADQCGLLGYVLSDVELENRKERIRTLSRLETISRKAADAILALDRESGSR